METYIVSIISAFLGYASSRFASRRRQGVLPTVGILCILACLAVLLTLGGHWITAPRPTPPPPPDKLEGQWIEQYDEGGQITYAIGTIRYNAEARGLEYFGDAYDMNLTLIGHWKTKQSLLDRDQYDYLFDGDSGNPKKPGHRHGVGGIHFIENGSHGTGYFLSVSDDPQPRKFELRKIVDEDAVKESKSNPEGYLKRFYNDPSRFKNGVTSAH
jgi:hypothetical protein